MSLEVTFQNAHKCFEMCFWANRRRPIFQTDSVRQPRSEKMTSELNGITVMDRLLLKHRYCMA